jgi:hypothetical protein
MWVPRNATELVEWDKATKREVSFNSALFCGLVWIGLSAMLAGGWVASSKYVAMQHSVSGTFWYRFLTFVVIGLPFAAWIFRREVRNEFQKASRMTICTKCDTASEANEGSPCTCGGAFVLQRTMRWFDEETNSK